jgi:hypothetical protein
VILSAVQLLPLALACRPRHGRLREHSSSMPPVIPASNTERSISSWIPNSPPTRLFRSLAKKTKVLLSTSVKHMTKSCSSLRVHSQCLVAFPRNATSKAISNCLQDGTETGKSSTMATSLGCVYGTTPLLRAGFTSSRTSPRVSPSPPALLSQAHPLLTQHLRTILRLPTHQRPHLPCLLGRALRSQPHLRRLQAQEARQLQLRLSRRYRRRLHGMVVDHLASMTTMATQTPRHKQQQQQ